MRYSVDSPSDLSLADDYAALSAYAFAGANSIHIDVRLVRRVQEVGILIYHRLAVIRQKMNSIFCHDVPFRTASALSSKLLPVGRLLGAMPTLAWA